MPNSSNSTAPANRTASDIKRRAISLVSLSVAFNYFVVCGVSWMTFSFSSLSSLGAMTTMQ
jgi:predicted acyltransferase